MSELLTKFIAYLLPFLEKVAVTAVEAVVAGGALGGLVELVKRIQIAVGVKKAEDSASRTR